MRYLQVYVNKLLFAQIEKDYIDRYIEGVIDIIPSCEVVIRWADQEGINTQPIHFQVDLKGAKRPRNFFIVDLDPSICIPQRSDQGEKISCCSKGSL